MYVNFKVKWYHITEKQKITSECKICRSEIETLHFQTKENKFTIQTHARCTQCQINTTGLLGTCDVLCYGSCV